MVFQSKYSTKQALWCTMKLSIQTGHSNTVMWITYALCYGASDKSWQQLLYHWNLQLPKNKMHVSIINQHINKTHNIVTRMPIWAICAAVSAVWAGTQTSLISQCNTMFDWSNMTFVQLSQRRKVHIFQEKWKLQMTCTCTYKHKILGVTSKVGSILKSGK